MRTPTIKEPTIKQQFVLFYFDFSFIAVVLGALVLNRSVSTILYDSTMWAIKSMAVYI